MGRSRGGLTTKIHLAADAHCRPLAIVLTAGQAGDAPACAHVMARLRVPRRRGRPRTRPDVVLADKTSHADKRHTPPARSASTSASAVSGRSSPFRPISGATGCGAAAGAAGHPHSTARQYKQRNTVERCINRLKQWRGIATRYEKTATIYLAGLHIAGIFLWSVR
ncbi:IS5 family transposase [Streptomyces sp. NBC_01257]|uniref:IS5 family transposase n=1 Tax=Streptomyces sp. NBC_01257 TaxID=2903799 RepID=UPI003FA38D59